MRARGGTIYKSSAWGLLAMSVDLTSSQVFPFGSQKLSDQRLGKNEAILRFELNSGESSVDQQGNSNRRRERIQRAHIDSLYFLVTHAQLSHTPKPYPQRMTMYSRQVKNLIRSLKDFHCRPIVRIFVITLWILLEFCLKKTMKGPGAEKRFL